MLIDFRVKNFRAIRNEQIFSLEADAGRSELPHVLRRPKGLATGMQLLPAGAVFGPNASGKTTLVRAMRAMDEMVLDSFSRSDDDRSPIHAVEPFLLDEATEAEPVELEVTFLADGVRYRYGFSVRDARVVHESLHHWPKGKQALVFERRGSEQEASSTFKCSDSIAGGRERAHFVAEQTHPQSLFVSTGQKLNHPAVAPVFSWFQRSFRLLDHTNRLNPRYSAERFLEDEEARAWTNQLMRWADLGIDEMSVTAVNLERGLPPSLSKLSDQVKKQLLRRHTIAGMHVSTNGTPVAFDLEKDESHGTERIFGLAAPLQDVLQNGRSLVVDELSTGFHHWMVRQLVRLFQDPETNPRGAQLIFTSHDPLLMDLTLLRRDQLYFVKKNTAGASEFYSLADIKGARKDAVQLHKHYLSGAFGAVPHLGDLTELTRAVGDK